MAIHIGLYWGMIINAVRKMTGITHPSRIRTIVLRFLAVLIVIYGLRTSFEREMGSKLTIYNPFGWYIGESTIGFLIDYLSIRGHLYLWDSLCTEICSKVRVKVSKKQGKESLLKVSV